MADLAKIVEDLSALTVLEAAELSKLLEEKWGVSAAAPVAMAMPAGGDKKINVIKEVRGVRSDLGLKEAKDLVEGAPQNVVENVSKQQADEIAKKLTEAGAKVQIK
jgi:large subunit ribosomal protein L7/L12